MCGRAAMVILLACIVQACAQASKPLLPRISNVQHWQGRHGQILQPPKRRIATWSDVRMGRVERSTGSESLYQRYRAWLEKHNLDSHGYLLKYEPWEHNGVSFVPNIFPYEMENSISHWVLWHHPEQLAGDTELQPDDERTLVCELLGKEVAAAAGHPDVHGDSACAWGPRDDEIVVFQNTPEMRSIPTIAHAHCFLRPRADAAGKRLECVLNERRMNREAQSPWLQHVAELSTKGMLFVQSPLAVATSMPAAALLSLFVGSGVAFAFSRSRRHELAAGEETLLTV
eukprot:gnl/TRDRNA2_/TRDRNA2_199372_c0_seq1.p1 gnl/TRDRNA2_/TRDRNA2_199372_c0~~gnl/TRDRNA2_/TRDRNA2_199372_c0_seq1.p1  ORF type:complete len:313 (-),score=29.64 gnl/TRDRNA2_/TRDRNA2_199372_c0_seq1:441-1298(-)